MTQHPLRRTALAAFAAHGLHRRSRARAGSGAGAGEEEAADDGAFDITATATVVSDYRFRGVSLSDRDPAVQGSVDITYRGFYAGAWASSISRYRRHQCRARSLCGLCRHGGPDRI